MNIDPEESEKTGSETVLYYLRDIRHRDYYSALAQQRIFPGGRSERPCVISGSYLQGHPDMKHIPGVDMSSGSLGQGISAAVGMAISAKLSNDDYRVYTLLGDGEIQEGQVWEAAMLAGSQKAGQPGSYR